MATVHRPRSVGLEMALRTSRNGRHGEAVGVAPKLHKAAFGRGLLGLAAASTTITTAVSEPPPWLDRNAYFAALSGAFFTGMAQVIASVRAGGWAAGRRGHGAGRKLVVYASVVVVAAGLTAASLLL